MKVRLSQESCVQALEQICAVALSSSPAPHLANVLIDVQSSAVCLTANDLQTSVSLSVRSESETVGKLSVPARSLLAAVKSFPCGELELRRDRTRLVLLNGDIRFDIAGIDGETFPTPGVSMVGGSKFSVEQKEFTRLIAQTHFAAARDEKRGVLAGVLLEVCGKLFSSVATDGRRLARAETFIESDAEVTAVLPKKAIAALRKASGEKGQVHILLSPRVARFVFEDGLSDTKVSPLASVEIVTKVFSEAYPNYRQAIPNRKGSVVTVRAQAFQEAVERAGLIANGDPVGTELLVEDGRLVFATKSARGKVLESVEAVGQCERYTGKFGAQVMIEPLRASFADSVSLELLPEPQCPVRMMSAGFLYLMMPMVDSVVAAKVPAPRL